jgi:hypothetical protein
MGRFYCRTEKKYRSHAVLLKKKKIKITAKFKFSSMATSENTVLVSFNVQLRSKQIVPWTILPVDRVNTIVLFVCQNSRIELVCVI